MGGPFPSDMCGGGVPELPPSPSTLSTSLSPSLPTHYGEGSSQKKGDQTIPRGAVPLDVAALWSVGAGSERPWGGERWRHRKREKSVMESCRDVGQQGCLSAGPQVLSQRH